MATKLSPEPCPYCEEHFELISPRQKHHFQNKECSRMRYREYMETWEPKNKPEPKPRPTRTAPVVMATIRNPLGYAKMSAHRHWGWLRRFGPEDFSQTIYLALAGEGISDYDNPVTVDIKSVDARLRSELKSLARSFGFYKGHDGEFKYIWKSFETPVKAGSTLTLGDALGRHFDGTRTRF